MALSDKWTRAQLRSAVRRELLDPTARWWTDAELNEYIHDWQMRVQEELELVWAQSTSTTSEGTHTLSSDVLRPDRIYWNGVRVPVRSRMAMVELQGDWHRTAASTPSVAYIADVSKFVLWPSPSYAGTLVLEYPVALSFTSDVTLMQLPAWTKYSAIPYCCYRAYIRNGPNHDVKRAMRRKQQFEKHLARLRRMKAAFMPEFAPTLRPASNYDNRIRIPRPLPTTNSHPMPVTVTSFFTYETPSGVVDGANPNFTITRAPTNSDALMLYKNGMLMVRGVDFNLTGTSITFIGDAIPQGASGGAPADVLRAFIF